MVIPVPPELQGRPFRLSEATALGLDRAFVRGKRFRRVFHSIYVSADLPDSVAVRADAAALVVPEDAAFSHQTAAELRGLPVPASMDIHVVVPRNCRGPQVTGIVVHRMDCLPGDIAMVDGRRLTSPARTWVDLAAQLSFTDLVVLGDATLNRLRLRVDSLATAANSAGRRRGAREARAATPHLEPRAESPAETRTRLILIRHGLPRPEAGLDLHDDHWEWIARPDLLYRDPPVVIQYDGADHFTDARRRRNDVARDELTRELGYEVVNVTARDLYAERRLVDRVIAAGSRAAGRRPRGFLVDPLTRRAV